MRSTALLASVLTVLIAVPALAGDNANVEIGLGLLTPECGLSGGDHIEFALAARNMVDARQILITFGWSPNTAVAAATALVPEDLANQGFLAPFDPILEEGQGELGIASFSAGLEGEALLAVFTLELAPHIVPTVAVDVWIGAVSLGPSSSVRDIIRPVDARLQLNRCNATAVTLEAQQTDRLNLGSNYPNPFNAATTIPFTVPLGLTQPVQLDIVNLAGQRLARLVDAVLPAGRHLHTWEARATGGHPLASGVYFYRLRLGAQEHIRPLMLLR
ncbi:MAG: T9SS type A sorting domain-containing protein [Candidatus Latescibacteria bacterium]|nr:T9SS type A sorting domain-containing protein [Candidatus Latescibacterota bacterium]